MVSRWLRENRKAGNRQTVLRMCIRQENHPWQVAWTRIRLAVTRSKYIRAPSGRIIEDEPIQNPSDPYRGWDDFFWLDHFHGPRTLEEEWVLRALHFLFRPIASQARSSSWLNDAGETIAEISQAQMIERTVRMANAPQTRRSLRIGGQRRNEWPRIVLPGRGSDDPGPSETSGSDFSGSE